MTERDSELIARAVSDAAEQHRKAYGDRFPLDGVAVVESIADACADQNPTFDRAQFMQACGVQS